MTSSTESVSALRNSSERCSTISATFTRAINTIIMPKLSKADKGAVISANEARRRKEVALAELREMEVAHRAGKLYDAAAVKSAVVTMNAAIREAVMRIPDKLAPQVAAVSTPREVRAFLRDSLQCPRYRRTCSMRAMQKNIVVRVGARLPFSGTVCSVPAIAPGQQGLGAPDSLSDNFFRLDRILFQSWNAPARGRGDHSIDGLHRIRAPSRAGQQ